MKLRKFFTGLPVLSGGSALIALGIFSIVATPFTGGISLFVGIGLIAGGLVGFGIGSKYISKSFSTHKTIRIDTPAISRRSSAVDSVIMHEDESSPDVSPVASPLITNKTPRNKPVKKTSSTGDLPSGKQETSITNLLKPKEKRKPFFNFKKEESKPEGDLIGRYGIITITSPPANKKDS